MSDHTPAVRYDRRKLFAVGASAGAAALVLPERAKALLESSAASRSTPWLIATLVDSPEKNAIEVIPLHTTATRRITVPQSARISAPDGSHRLQTFSSGDHILIELAPPSSRDASTGQLNLAKNPTARTVTALTFGKAEDFHR
jgi:hypothetical protein